MRISDWSSDVCSSDLDVGHSLVVGPTGAGKSVLLALMTLQFRRYEHGQIFAFDFGGSIRAATLAMGGDWQELGGALPDDGGGVALQPLARIDDAGARARAAGRSEQRRVGQGWVRSCRSRVSAFHYA